MSYIRVTKHYLHLPYIWLGAIEFGFIYLSYYLVDRLESAAPFLFSGPVFFESSSALVYALVLSLGSLAMGVYPAMMREGFVSMLFRTLVAYCFLGAAGIAVLAMLIPALNISSSALLWLVFCTAVFTVGVRSIFCQIIDSRQLTRRVLVLGHGQVAQDLKEVCDKDGLNFGVEVAGLMSLSGEEDGVLSLPDNLLSYCEQNDISEIIIALEEQRRTDGLQLPLDQLAQCKVSGIQVNSAVEFYEKNRHQVKLNLIRPSWIIFSDGFHVTTSRRVLKRLFDLTISLMLAVVLAPFIVLAMALVFIETGRPIFYSQVRTGLNGKDFRIYKIRSMRQDAEKGGKAVWAKANDSRITKVGAFIRNTRLDELPQLWNVLRGDMSFVGPRPERPEFVEQLNKEIPNYEYRHSVKPGLMGWAQLNYPYGASVEDARGKLEYDLYYTKNHSFIMDLIIMVQTVEVVLLGKGVH